jgi:hypothetical protein
MSELIAATVSMVVIIGIIFGAYFVIDAVISLWPKSVQIQTCTRKLPHVCKIDGPCNGWPKG